MSKRYIVDIEGNGLLDTISKIHCIGYCETSTGLVCSTSYQNQIKDFFLQEDVTLIMHNGILFDAVAIEKVLGIKIKCKIWDTLALSWILYPFRDKHGLGAYGEEFGIPKPEIEDWENLPISEYIRRVEEDVKINLQVWKKCAGYLNNLYEGNHEEIVRFLDYTSFKLECIKEQESEGVRLDIDKCKANLKVLEDLKEEKIVKLKESMPKRAIKHSKFPPKIMYKKDGSPSENRIKWLKFLEEQNLPINHNTEVEFIHSYEEPNPNSHDQLKTWLFGLGWEPQHFVYKKQEGQKEMRKIPQIKSKDEEGEVCESIRKLFVREPNLEALDSLFIISHRIGILQGFLDEQRNGFLYPSISGLTNTMRFTHKKPVVNLPTIHKKYGEEIRSCLIKRDENSILCGYDLAGIETATKYHYIQPFDPKYVEEMNTEGYDPHLDLAIQIGWITEEQAENHKKGIEKVGDLRQKAKTCNYALTYKCMPPTLSRNSGLTLKEAKAAYDAYWKRNKSVLDAENNFKTKELGGQKWIFNPVSKFWYTLRAEKDKFATTNSSTAVYCFDRWIYYIRQQNIRLCLQMHDEGLSNIYLDYKDLTKEKINKAIDQVNKELKLNVKIGCSVQFGDSYADCH